MQRATENKIIVVVRRTRIDDLKARFNTKEQARFYVEHQGVDFCEYEEEDTNYKDSTDSAIHILQKWGRVHLITRDFLPNFIFAEKDIVVVLGQDGLVANTVKYLNGQSVVGINPDPGRWDGVLLPFQVHDLNKIIPEVFAKRRPIKEVTMAKATLNNGQVLYAVNDLFIGQQTHTSARYIIQLGHELEAQSSSGIIVSTGLGSTGWFKSLITGATSIAQTLMQTGKLAAINTKTGRIEAVPNSQFPWNANYLQFVVREPFPSAISSATLVFGKITDGQSLHLTSQMSEKGVIFSDGIEQDFLEFNSGTQATIGLADKRGFLVI